MLSLKVAATLFSLSTAMANLVEYNWTLRNLRASSKDTSLSVDCNLDRLMLLVNGEYPGPAIRASVGDTVRINLVNEDPSTSFTLHHHGLHMLGQPYYDGAAGASQCATGVLQTQIYEFVVNEAGTHYWHGHMGMERGDYLPEMKSILTSYLLCNLDIQPSLSPIRMMKKKHNLNQCTMMKK